MPRLTVLVPDQSAQAYDVGPRGLVVGRGEDCDVRLAEVRASRRHLRLRRLEDGTWVAEDLDSSNGTWGSSRSEPGEQRLLRRALADGDTLRIGETRLVFEAEADRAAQGPLVAGSLHLEPVAPEPPAAPAAESVPAAEPPGRRAPATARGRAPAGRPPLRALALVGAGALALVVAQVWLGGRAAREGARAEAHRAVREALRHYPAALADPEGPAGTAFEAALADVGARHPAAPDRLVLEGYAERFRERRDLRRELGARLEDLERRIETESASGLRREYLALARRLPDDADFATRVRGALAELDRRRGAADLALLADLARRVDGALGAGLPALAGRWIDSFERARPGGPGAVAEGLAALRARCDAALRALREEAATEPAADAQAGPLERRLRLARLWPGLEGTREGQAIEEELRATRRPPAAPGPAAPAAAPPGPGTPSAPAPDLLARAQQAEEWLAARRWPAARAAFATLAAEVPAGMLRAEWEARVEELDAVLGLVARLAERAAAEPRPRVRLAEGLRQVLAAGPEGVTLLDGGEARERPWETLEADAVLALLAPPRPAPADRLAVAALAAQLGRRDAFVEALLPLYERREEPLAGRADRLVARALYGRTEVPEGGYAAHRGELLDRAGLERARAAERAEALGQRARDLLAQVAKLPPFQRLARLEEARAELDRRRTYALLAIFNTTHYPYPADKAALPYRAVQEEVDRRVAAVRELYEKDTTRVRVEREGRLAKVLEEWDAVLAELKALREDTTALAGAMERHTQYLGHALDLRTYFRDRDERDLLAYNRWVMEAYNPARTEYAQPPELQQVAITNAYRALLGYTAVVEPGPAPYESITKDNVVAVLDAGRVVRVVPLRAVRVDNRLCQAAREHSLDMAARGFFAHEAPANPRTGEGPTAPHDRMRRAGYHGYGYSENIAGAPDPLTAHQRWCHSSGHHRNILSVWTDLGVGAAGNRWTQNFASGGGAPAEVAPDTAIRPPAPGPRPAAPGPRAPDGEPGGGQPPGDR